MQGTNLYQYKTPESLSQIKSTSFEIHQVQFMNKPQLIYFPKNDHPDLQQFIQKDTGFNHNCEFLRKLISRDERSNILFFEQPENGIILSQNKFPKEQTILKILYQLLQALQVLHKNCILGRCFNANNILYSNSKCVMMEFGYYPDIDYKVPEIIYNQGQYSERSDVFLLGCVLYNLMVGQDIPKFENMSDLDKISNNINLEISKTQYPDYLKKLVQEMLITDQYNRKQLKALIQLYRKNTNSNVEYFCNFYDNEFPIRLLPEIKKLKESRDQIDQQLYDSSLFILQSQSQIISNQQGNISQLSISQLVPNDNSQNLQPPLVRSIQLYNETNQGEEENNIQLITQRIQDPTLQKTLNLHQNKLHGLIFVNEQSEDDYIIWNQIYFSQYRFSLLQKTIGQLQELSNQQNNYVISIGLFALRKTQIILLKQFCQQLSQDKNIFQIEQAEWEIFINKSQQYKRMKENLKRDLEIKTTYFNSHQRQQSNICLNKFKSESIMIEIVKNSESFLSENLDYTSFDEFKSMYRYIITITLSQFDNSKGKQFSQIKLLLLMCILINRICDHSSIQLHFKTILRVLNLEKLSAIIEIEQFFEKGDENDFNSQFDELKQIYFSG